MDTWPSTSGGTGDRAQTAGRRKRKGKEREDAWEIPIVESGAITAGTLSRQSTGRFAWVFACGDEVGSRLVSRRAELVVSATSPPTPRLPRASTTLRAEQGAHFLRTRYPDVDIPAELIREHLAADLATERSTKEYDPLAGDLLAPFTCAEGPRRRSTFLAYPAGPLKDQLSVSPLLNSSHEGARLRPGPQVCWASKTPIQQIMAGKPTNEEVSAATFLAVRTMGSVHFLEVKTKPAGRETVPELKTTSIGAVSHSEIDGKPAMDVGFRLGSNPSAVIINSEGFVYERLLEGSSEIRRLWAPSTDALYDDPFWRLNVATKDDGCFVSSCRRVIHFDRRIRDSTSIIYEYQKLGHLITSMDVDAEENILCISATNELLWVDRRFNRSPVLGCKHNRQMDRTLKARWATVAGESLTYMASRHNGLVMVYDISRPPTEPMRFKVPPYSLYPAFPNQDGNLDIIAIQPPSDSNPKQLAFYELDPRSSIRCLKVEMTDDHATSTGRQGQDATAVEWSAEVGEWQNNGTSTSEEPSVFSRQDYSELDMRPIYEALFSPEDTTLAGHRPEAVYEIIETMGDFWKSVEAPVEHMLTTYDVAFRSGDEPSQAARADFFTSSPLNSTRGFRALTQSRIPRRQLSKQAPWHLSLDFFMNRFIEGYSDDPQTTVQNAHAFDLLADDQPASSAKRESEACEQLALDLALAADVYSPVTFANASSARSANELVDEALETMSLATGAMSLVDDAEPSRIQYEYLRPQRRDRASYYASVAQDAGSITLTEEEKDQSIGVRLLLQEWTTGTDAETYQYSDPYGRSANTATIRTAGTRRTATQQTVTQRIGPPSLRPPAVAIVNTRAPPAIAISSQPAPAPSRPLGPTTLYDIPPRLPATQRSDAGVPASSQGVIPSTQVLPGPFGGRQSMAKKKAAKKRVGGF